MSGQSCRQTTLAGLWSLTSQPGLDKGESSLRPLQHEVVAACIRGVRTLQGSTVSDDQIFAVVDCLLRLQRLTYSADAVYAFLAASNVYNLDTASGEGAAQTGWPPACMHVQSLDTCQPSSCHMLTSLPGGHV